MWQNVLVKAKSLLQFHHLVLVTQTSCDVCLYKVSHSFLAYADRVEAGTGSCLMTRFLETDSILSSGRFRDEDVLQSSSLFLPYSKLDLKKQR